MLGIVFAIIAVFVIVVAMSASILKCEQIDRDPPDDDGCREDDYRE